MTTKQIRHVLVAIGDVTRAPKIKLRKAAALTEASGAHESARMALSQHTKPNSDGSNVHVGEPSPFATQLRKTLNLVPAHTWSAATTCAPGVNNPAGTCSVTKGNLREVFGRSRMGSKPRPHHAKEMNACSGNAIALLDAR
jgi:hypothetical protein